VSTAARSRRRSRTRGTAGVSTVRTLLAELLGLYGVVLVGIALIGGSGDAAAGPGRLGADLWVGVGLVVLALLVADWRRVRPVDAEPPPDRHPAG
jgi:hypothetical protein